MGLKDLFRNNNGLALPAIDEFLTKNIEESDRAFNVNAPSQTGNCNRQNFYARTGTEGDYSTTDPRTERIFNNGSAVHERIQTYLEQSGILLMREVPLKNDEHNIQGHTDGLMIDKSQGDLVILEIKSINSNGFSVIKQKGAKPEHIKQGNVYAYCLEQHRQYLHRKYPTLESFNKSLKFRMAKYSKYYKHLKSGSKFTRKQKLAFKINEHIKADEILYNTKKPITRISFVYECKDTQEIREIIINTDKQLMENILNRFDILDEAVKTGEPPEREGRVKSDPICRYCPYKISCWN